VALGQTFILVHGGLHGAWCFERLADRLMRYGGDVDLSPSSPPIAALAAVGDAPRVIASDRRRS
jgi:hypothetical protein